MQLFFHKLLRSCSLLFLFLLPFSSIAIQQDSLIQVLSGLKGAEKVDALNKLSWEIKFSETAKAINYGDESLALSKSIDYQAGLAEAYYNLTVLYYIQQKFLRSNEYGNEAIKHYQELEDITGMARSWNMIGLNELSLGNHEQALYYFKNALQQFKTVNNEENILKIEANIGSVHYRMGEFEKALQSYLRIVEYARKTEDEDLLITNLQNVGFAYSEIGQYAKSLESSFEVLHIVREQNDSSRLPNTLQSIASTFNRLEMYKEAIVSVNEAIVIDERFQKERRLGSSYITLANALKGEGYIDSAFYYHKKAKEIYEKVGNKSMGMVLNNLGTIYHKKGEQKEAEVYFEKALEVSKKQMNEAVVALSKYNLGTLYFEINELEKAELVFLEAYDYWNESKKYKELSSVTKELSRLYSTLGKHQLAFDYQNKHDIAEDSVFGRKKQNEVMRLMVRQKSAEQESSFRDLEVIDDKDISFFYWIVILVFVLVISIWIMMRFVFNKQRTIEKLQSDLDRKGRELAFLSLSAMQKENFIQEFTDKLKPLTIQYPRNQELRALMRNIKMQEVQDDHWNQFKAAFEQIAPHFFDHLLTNYPNLTETDLRFCALIRLAVPTKEIARIAGISTESVNKARYRLRKRLNIGSGESLDRYILSI